MPRRQKKKQQQTKEGDAAGGETAIELQQPQYRQKEYTTQELTQLEDKVCKSGNIARAGKQSNSKDAAPLDAGGPWRPSYGVVGRPITVLANYMQLLPSPPVVPSAASHARHLEIVLHSYSITIVPDVAKRKRAQVVRLWLNELVAGEPSEPTPISVATDFQGRIITDRVLSDSAFLRTVRYRRDADQAAGNSAAEYRVTLDANESLRFQFSDLLEYLKTVGQPRDIPPGTLSHASLNTEPGAVASPTDWVQALNIILNYHARIHPETRTIIGGGRVFGIASASTESGQSNDVSPSISIGGALEAIRGFYSSTRLATGRVLINVNVTTAVFFRGNIPLTRLMNEFVEQKYPFDYKKSPWSAATLAGLHNFIRGLHVRMTHMADRPIATYSVFGLANPHQTARYNPRKSKYGGGESSSARPPASHPPAVASLGAGPRDVQFWYSPDRSTPDVGSLVTVNDHFAKQYPTYKLDPAYPVVNVGDAGHPVFMPAEVCIVLPGHLAARAQLDERQRTELINFAVRQPAKNADDILTKAPHILAFASSEDFKDPKANISRGFGLVVKDQQLVQACARILPAPPLMFAKLPGTVLGRGPSAVGAGTVIQPHAQRGDWNLKDTKFSSAGHIGSDWACILVVLGRQQRPEVHPSVNTALDKFVGSMRQHGISVGNPSSVFNVGNDPALISTAFESLLARSQGRVKMILVVLPNSSASTYNAIKYIGDIRLGVSTVCVEYSKFVKSSLPYFSNVALKINLKLGGCNHRLALGPVASSTGGHGGGQGGLFRGRGGFQTNTTRSPDKSVFSLSPIDPDTTMIVGIDVTHPSPGSASSAPSIAAMVASTDGHLSQWPAELRLQERARDEMVRNTVLEDMAVCHLKRWQERHSMSLPRSVLVYRDGVSEGQYAFVINEEIPQLRKAFDRMYGEAPKPPLTVVIVGKRHHTRFYPTDGEADGSTHRDNTGNCLPGTVVDRGVTLASNWDFFLQAHRAIKGTARPAHYHVVCDEIFRSRCADPISEVKNGDKVKALTNKIKKMTMGVDLTRRPAGGGASGSGSGPSAAEKETSTLSATDALQRVTQALCFIFGRATGAVGIATPAYYADLACDRARRYLTQWYDAAEDDGRGGHQEPEENLAEQTRRIAIHARLKETMFYI